MTKRLLLIIFVALTLTVGGVFYGIKGRYKVGAANVSPAAQKKFKEQEVYEHLFRYYAYLKAKDDKAVIEGKEPKLSKMFRDEANLTPKESDEFDKVAAACAHKLKETDTTAKLIIDATRAQYPGGGLKPGQAPPTPPAELNQLQAEREDTVFKAKKHLENSFGKESFGYFAAFVQRKVADKMKDIKPSDYKRPQRKAANNGKATDNDKKEEK